MTKLAIYLALAAALVGGTLAGVYGLVAYGRKIEAAAQQRAALENTVKIIKERRSTDDEVSKLNGADLCRAILVGVPDDIDECVRRLEQAAP